MFLEKANRLAFIAGVRQGFLAAFKILGQIPLTGDGKQSCGQE